MRIIKDDLKKIIVDGDTRVLVERSQGFGSDLAKDLKRKDRALAEATALLVLKKKADLIWGTKEDE